MRGRGSVGENLRGGRRRSRWVVGALLAAAVAWTAACGEPDAEADESEELGLPEEDAEENETEELRYVTMDAMYGPGPVENGLRGVAIRNGVMLDLTGYFFVGRPTDLYDPYHMVASGQYDVSTFSTLAHLASYNAMLGRDLATVGSTYYALIGLFARGLDSVDDLPEGTVVAVPDHPSYLARALLLLDSADLITVREGVLVPRESDIVDNPGGIVVEPMNWGAVVSNSFDGEARVAPLVELRFSVGASPIFTEDPDDERLWPYVNVAVVHPDRLTEPLLQDFVGFYGDPEVTAVTAGDQFGASFVVRHVPAEDLADGLAELEAEIRAWD